MQLLYSYQDYLVGADIDFDSSSQKLNRVDIAVAYSVSDFGFHGIISHWAQTYTAGIYQRLSDRLEYAAEVSSLQIFIVYSNTFDLLFLI